jgi:hypothetical protein
MSKFTLGDFSCKISDCLRRSGRPGVHACMAFIIPPCKLAPSFELPPPFVLISRSLKPQLFTNCELLAWREEREALQQSWPKQRCPPPHTPQPRTHHAAAAILAWARYEHMAHRVGSSLLARPMLAAPRFRHACPPHSATATLGAAAHASSSASLQSTSIGAENEAVYTGECAVQGCGAWPCSNVRHPGLRCSLLRLSLTSHAFLPHGAAGLQGRHRPQSSCQPCRSHDTAWRGGERGWVWVGGLGWGVGRFGMVCVCMWWWWGGGLC